MVDVPAMDAIKKMDHRGWRTKTVDATFPVSEGPAGLEAALDRICAEADNAVAEGYSVVVLSDRGVSADRVAVPTLLSVATAHSHLVRTMQRTQLALMVESGEAREVHHFCTLVGYGADGICPYLAIETLEALQAEGRTGAKPFEREELVARYFKSAGDGMLKVMAKMGISTLASYKGAQIFEALGLNADVIGKWYFGASLAPVKSSEQLRQVVDVDAAEAKRSLRRCVTDPSLRPHRPFDDETLTASTARTRTAAARAAHATRRRWPPRPAPTRTPFGAEKKGPPTRMPRQETSPDRKSVV